MTEYIYWIGYYAIAALAATASVIALGCARAGNRDRRAAQHWQARAIDLQMDETERRLARVMRAKHARRCQLERARTPTT